MLKNKKVIIVTIVFVVTIAYFIFPSKKKDLVKFEVDPIDSNQNNRPDPTTNIPKVNKTIENKTVQLPDSFKQKVASISSISQAQKVIQDRLKCYADESCGPSGKDEHDPKYRYFSQSSEIRAILEQIENQVNDANSKQLQTLVKSLETLDDDWVKAKLVSYIGKLSPTESNLKSLKSATLASNDPSVYQNSIKTMLSKYKQKYSQEVNNFVQTSIKSNSYYVGLYMSTQLKSFLNEDNISSYKNLLKSLPKSSKKYLNVYNALANFKN